MRISDWSSDVCSSDLQGPEGVHRVLRLLHGEADQVVGGGIDLLRRLGAEPPRLELRGLVARADGAVRVLAFEPDAHRRALVVDPPRGLRDRKPVVWGKSVAVRVDLGGRRELKK